MEEKLRLTLWLCRVPVPGDNGKLLPSRQAESLKHIDLRCAKLMYAMSQVQRRCRKLVNDDFAAAASVRDQTFVDAIQRCDPYMVAKLCDRIGHGNRVS